MSEAADEAARRFVMSAVVAGVHDDVEAEPHPTKVDTFTLTFLSGWTVEVKVADVSPRGRA